MNARIALLTGRSSFASSALSPAQLSFLHSVAPPGTEVIPIGFPFEESTLGAGYRDVSMIAASWRNGLQVWWTISSAGFRRQVADRLQFLLDSTGERLILITGSCGLQLANRAWPHLRVREDLAVDVVALGPACLDPLRMPATVVQGRRDGWSRLFYSGPVHHRTPCAHLDYWDSAETRRLVAGLLR